MSTSDKIRACPHCGHSPDTSAAHICPSCGGSLATANRKHRWFHAGMAAVASVTAGAVLLLLVAGIIYDRRNNPHTIFRFGKASEPVYQWVQSEDKAFSFLPGEGKAWGPVEPQAGEIHYSISAYLPVDTGLMDMQWEDRMDGWSAMKTSASCYESKITSSSKVCLMPNQKPSLIFIRDLRAKQFGLGGLTPELVSPKTIQEQNSVTVTIFTRKCLENCR